MLSILWCSFKSQSTWRLKLIFINFLCWKTNSGVKDSFSNFFDLWNRFDLMWRFKSWSNRWRIYMSGLHSINLRHISWNMMSFLQSWSSEFLSFVSNFHLLAIIKQLVVMNNILTTFLYKVCLRLIILQIFI